jgi:hypothetical protein
MQEGRWYHGIGPAAGVFALAFLVCVVVIPIAGLLLGILLAPVGLGAVAAVIFFPAFALWLGELYVVRGDCMLGDHIDGCHALPLVVWLVTWAAFALAARKLSGWRRAAAAAVVIVGVTWGLYSVLTALSIRLVIDVP